MYVKIMDLIKEINDKYSALEAEVDKRLENIKLDEEKLANRKWSKSTDKFSNTQVLQELNYEQALARNTDILKSLERAKARLRSRSTFSPVESILKKAITNYKKDLQSQGNRTGTIVTTTTEQQPSDEPISKPTENIYDVLLQ